jgi:phospholipid:diacylglycerol acyltransferase
LTAGYWIWQKIVENLATLGYDTNSMDMAAYDWWVSF